MKLIQILDRPSYGWETSSGNLVVPSLRELFREFAHKLNLFDTRKNWVAVFSWATFGFFLLFVVAFATFYFSWTLFAIGFVYSMIILGTHGTIWYHRYATHRAYTFSHPFWRWVTSNLVVKLVVDELYVVSHHVHHSLSEKPGDPYNVFGGWWYCFLADAVHQPIARDLSRKDYEQVSRMINHTGTRLNSYEQYQRWGSICHPVPTLIQFVGNWAFWYAAFYLMGGHPLAICIFAASGVWAFGIRTFNFSGHGSGKDKRRDGIDFGRTDHSINQAWPGLITGEWHNNHHLYPNSARAGFLSYQFDPAWYYIKGMHALGAISSYRDSKEEFCAKYLNQDRSSGASSPLSREPVS